MGITSRHGRRAHVWKHSPFARKRCELEEKVDDFGWPPFETRGVWRSTAWAPDFDLFVKNNHLIARMDLPGFTAEHVAIEMGDGGLTLRGTWPREAAHDPSYRCAGEFGSFYSIVPLPKGTTRDDVKVTFADGILEIAIAAPAMPAAPRTSEIEQTAHHC